MIRKERDFAVPQFIEKGTKRVLLWMALLIALSGCSSVPQPGLPAGKAGEVVGAAIEAAGGWSEWKRKTSVDYFKRTIQFDEQGAPFSQQLQRHRYLLSPQFKARIEWEEEGRQIVLINDGEQAFKLVDGQLASAQSDRDQAWNSTFGSHYVFCMPFKLTDPGTELEYVGRRALPDGTEADRIEVNYAPGAGSSAGQHFWTYYFSASDSQLVANHLRHGPSPDQNLFTEYGQVREIDGLRLPTIRYSYASDPDQRRLQKLSEISYSEIRFDSVDDQSLFSPP